MGQEKKTTPDFIPKHVLAKFANKGKKSYTNVFFHLMKELHLSDEQLLDMPISRIQVLVKELSEYKKEEADSYKKSSKGLKK